MPAASEQLGHADAIVSVRTRLKQQKPSFCDTTTVEFSHPDPGQWIEKWIMKWIYNRSGYRWSIWFSFLFRSLLLSSTVPVVWLCLDMAVSYEKDGQEGARNHWHLGKDRSGFSISSHHQIHSWQIGASNWQSIENTWEAPKKPGKIIIFFWTLWRQSWYFISYSLFSDAKLSASHRFLWMCRLQTFTDILKNMFLQFLNLLLKLNMVGTWQHHTILVLKLSLALFPVDLRLVVSIAYWLGSLPITAAWMFWVAKKFRKPCRSKCCDRLATVLVLASAIPAAGQQEPSAEKFGQVGRWKFRGQPLMGAV